MIAFKNSLMETAIPDYLEYAKIIPTAKPDQWPTAFDYLEYTSKKLASVSTVSEAYAYLQDYQRAALRVCQYVVGRCANVHEAYSRYGISGIKYGNWTIDCRKESCSFRIVSVCHEQSLPNTIDADELNLIYSKLLSIEELLKAKKGKSVKAVLTNNSIVLKSLAEVNQHELLDWAAPLWKGVA